MLQIKIIFTIIVLWVMLYFFACFNSKISDWIESKLGSDEIITFIFVIPILTTFLYLIWTI